MILQPGLAKKQIGVAAIAVLAVLFPPILPFLLGIVLLAQGGEAFFSKGLAGVLDLGAWSRLYPACALFLFPLVAFALLPWAEWPGRSALRAFRLSGEILMALGLAGILLRLPSELAVRRARALTLGLCIGAGLAIADCLSHGGLTGFLRSQPVEAITYGRSAVLVALMTVPTLLAAPFSSFNRFLLVIPGLILVAISVNLAAKLLLPVAVLGALLGRWVRWGGGVLIVLALSSLIILPWILPFSLSPEQECTLWLQKASAMHRLQIWAYVSDLIRQRPWGGWGLDAARYLGVVAPELHIPACAHAILGSDRVPLLPLHPHNGILQLWMELGVLGAILLPSMILIILQKIKNYSRIPYTSTLAALAGMTIPILISFGLWQGWWISTLIFFWGILLLYFSPYS